MKTVGCIERVTTYATMNAQRNTQHNFSNHLANPRALAPAMLYPPSEHYHSVHDGKCTACSPKLRKQYNDTSTVANLNHFREENVWITSVQQKPITFNDRLYLYESIMQSKAEQSISFGNFYSQFHFQYHPLWEFQYQV